LNQNNHKPKRANFYSSNLSFGMHLEEDCYEVEVTPNLELLVTFGMSLKGDCYEVEVTHNLELLVTFGMSLKGVCNELYT
jgi:hypothetical protein